MKILSIIKDHIETTKNQIKIAERTLETMLDRSHYLRFDEEMNDYVDDEFDSNSEYLEYILRSIFLRLLFAYEYLGADICARELKNDFNFLSKELQSFYIDKYGFHARNKVLDKLNMYLNALFEGQYYEDNEPGNNITKSELLKQILKNTANIIYDRNIDPKNEAEVRHAVFHIMKHSFPDTVREIPIPKSVQTYKPDLGVKALRTAIEYKFANSDKEVKTSIRGILEDMKGYSGSRDWIKFYAVIYMTEAFYTEEQILNDLVADKASENWEFIILNGRGNRKKRQA